MMTMAPISSSSYPATSTLLYTENAIYEQASKPYKKPGNAVPSLDLT